MSVPSLATLVEKNYTGDVEGLESLSPSSFVASALHADTPSTPSTVVIEKKLETSLVDLEDPSRKLTKAEAEELRQTEKEYKEALAYIKDVIAPSMMRIDATKLQIGDTYVRTIFTYAYPDVLETSLCLR